VSVPVGYDGVLAEKLICRLAEGFTTFDLTGAVLSPERQIPVFGKVLCLGQAVLFRRDSPVASLQKCRALPVTTICPFIYLDASSHYRVLLHATSACVQIV